jgi:transposase-like protein
MFKTPGKGAAERGKYWTRVIEKARLYPTGITSYCRDTNVSKNNYYSWFKKLRVDHPEWEDLNGRGEESGSAAAAEPLAKPIDIEVQEPKQRRKFSGSFKTKILNEVDAAEGGKVASILRREGIYASHISKWRHERRLGSTEAVKRGPKTNPLAAENAQLRAENLKLKKHLHRSTALLDLQKKVSEILGVNLQQSMDEE